MPRPPIPTWCFALVVVRRGDRFLLVQEATGDWYVPAGRVEEGESFAVAALRETLEEAGIPVRLVGILRIEHTPRPQGSRLRVIYLAEPVGDTPPKSVADDESLQAAWVSLEELPGYRLRGDEVSELLKYVSSGGVAHPLSLLEQEGAPFFRIDEAANRESAT